MNAEDRYQVKPWYVRSYRWLRWMPIAYAIASWKVVLWILSGAQPISLPGDDESEFFKTITLSRRQTASSIWSHVIGWYQVSRMQWWWSLDEFFDDYESLGGTE